MKPCWETCCLFLLAPYDNTAALRCRIRVSVPRTTVGSAGATSFALVIHELATNSMKYGALAAKTGTLDVSCQTEDDMVGLVWTERGGPTVQAPNDLGGFGSRLLRSSMAQLSGQVTHN